MSTLLDTNVLSELARPKPDNAVTTYLRQETSAHISVVTLHELVFGARRVTDSLKRQGLLDWIGAIENRYQSSLIQVSREIARLAADFRAELQQHGRILHIEDALIAATASVYSLTLVTRNTRDFESIDVQLVNPWHIQA